MTKLDVAAAQTGTSKVDGLNIRQKASMQSAIIGSLYTGDKVTITGTQGAYYKISYNGTTAYVGKSYITVSSSDSNSSSSTSSSSKKTGSVTANSLTVRKSASTSSASLGYLQKGTKVTITGTTGNFYKITYNGGTAYVSKSYVSTGSSSSTSSSSSKSAGQAVVDYAIQFVGNPYVTGGTSLTRGADCSGFVMSVYKKFGVSLPHSSYAMRSYGKAVSRSNIQPGDVICYSGHVAIYVGNGRTVAARNSRAGIGYSNAWYTSVITIRRFV
jgi:cell wall-associated NlpC family hydrolase